MYCTRANVHVLCTHCTRANVHVLCTHCTRAMYTLYTCYVHIVHVPCTHCTRVHVLHLLWVPTHGAVVCVRPVCTIFTAESYSLDCIVLRTPCPRFSRLLLFRTIIAVLCHNMAVCKCAPHAENNYFVFSTKTLKKSLLACEWNNGSILGMVTPLHGP